ncbi:DUF5937 family protein [Streptomyces sp. NPDC050560]|uniref:ArsR/SmtB family transcription factor n=1 Tax=Streptomyces sp. NPDC050560 TaxID=3365630 RepID=UPI0037AA6512
MPMHLRFGEEDLLRCRFAVSPLWETQEAVRTLKRPERHGYHQGWLRRIRDAAAGLDLEPLWLLMPQRGHSPDFFGPPVESAASFADEIAAARATGPDLARSDLAKSLADTPGAADTPRGRAMLADPAGAVRELADCLEAAWHALVEPHWPRLRALLEADVAFHSRRLAQVGLGGLLSEIDPRLRWEKGTLVVTGGRRRQVWDLGGQGLCLLPSVFIWPDVATGVAPPYKQVLGYPARGIGGLWAPPDEQTPRALVRLLGRGRAAVFAALDEPASTTALAHRTGLAPSSVSGHLSALRGAGLLVSRRYGHQMLYERTPLGIALATGGR